MDAKSSRTAQSKASSTHFAGEGDERLQCALLPRGHWPAHRWFDVDVVPQFENPFHMEDMMVFDDATLQSILCGNGFGLTVEKLAYSLRGMPKELVRRTIDNMQTEKRASFLAAGRAPRAQRPHYFSARPESLQAFACRVARALHR